MPVPFFSAVEYFFPDGFNQTVALSSLNASLTILDNAFGELSVEMRELIVMTRELSVEVRELIVVAGELSVEVRKLIVVVGELSVVIR